MFYVYELIDPRDDLAFYVGKGTSEFNVSYRIENRA